MALVSMKRQKKTKKEGKDTACWPDEVYPWGLRISLSQEELDKLGIKAVSFKIGSDVSISASAKITSIRILAENKKEDATVEMQITGLSLGKINRETIDDKIKKSNDMKKAGPGE